MSILINIVLTSSPSLNELAFQTIRPLSSEQNSCISPHQHDTIGCGTTKVPNLVIAHPGKRCERLVSEISLLVRPSLLQTRTIFATLMTIIGAKRKHPLGGQALQLSKSIPST